MLYLRAIILYGRAFESSCFPIVHSLLYFRDATRLWLAYARPRQPTFLPITVFYGTRVRSHRAEGSGQGHRAGVKAFLSRRSEYLSVCGVVSCDIPFVN